MFIYEKSNGVGYFYSTLLKSRHAFSAREGGVASFSAERYSESLVSSAFKGRAKNQSRRQKKHM